MDGLAGVRFSPLGPPEPLGGKFGHGLARDATDDPSEHAETDRLVVECIPMLSLGLG